MGGGGGDGPDRDPYEEYEDPEPAGEETDEQRSLVESLAAEAESAEDESAGSPRFSTDPAELTAFPRVRVEFSPSELPAELTPIIPVSGDASEATRRTVRGISVDLNNIVPVEAAIQSDSERVEVYYSLHPEEFRAIEQQLFEKYDTEADQEAVETMLSRMREWKRGSGRFIAMQYEAAFRRGLNIDAEVRDLFWLEETPAEALASVTGPQQEVATDLYALSRAFVRHHLGDSFMLYRGVGHDLREPAIAMFDNPEQEQYPYSLNALENFSVSEAVPSHYSEVVLEQTFSPEDIGDASDLLVVVSEGGEVISEGEIRVRGDSVTKIGREQLQVDGEDQPLAEAIRSIPDLATVIESLDDTAHQPLSDAQLQAIGEAVRSMYDYDRSENTITHVEGPTTEQGKSRINWWFMLYENRFSSDDAETPSDMDVLARAVEVLKQ